MSLVCSPVDYAAVGGMDTALSCVIVLNLDPDIIPIPI